MDQPERADVLVRVTQVAAYGNQIASSFHQYDASEMNVPSGFDCLSKFVNTTTTSLVQLVNLLNEEAEALEKGNGKSLFSNEGRQYVYTLATECGKAFFAVEKTILEASKGGKNVKAKSKKSNTRAPSQVVNFTKLELQDERDFLDKIEKARTIFDSLRMDHIGDKIYDINRYALLMVQVVNVGKLSKDFSSGQVDVRTIAAMHKRITRAARMMNIDIPKSTLHSRYSDSNDSSYSSGSSITASESGSESDSDSDDSRLASRTRRTSKAASRGPPQGSKGPPVMIYPCGPPPAPAAPQAPPVQVDWFGVAIPPPPHSSRPLNQSLPGVAPPPVSPLKLPVVEAVKPPSYCEIRENGASPNIPNAGENAISNADAKKVIGAILTTESENRKSSPAPMDSKTKNECDSASAPKAIQPNPPNAQLFKSQPRGFGFKLRTMFRSNESLAAEMKATLESTQHRLSAFLIQGHSSRLVPHSVFHSLESTHMRTILAQIGDKDWYKTYTSLNASESQTVQRTLYSNGPRLAQAAELIVLKVVKENRLIEWVTLLKKLRQQAPFVNVNEGRVILAIVRDAVVPPPPPMPFHHGPPRPMPRQASPRLPPSLTILRPDVRLAPSALPSQPRNRISDLRSPYPGAPRPGPGPPPGWPHPKHTGPPVGHPLPPPPPILSKFNAPASTSPAIDKPNSPDLAQNDEEAFLALTEYLEYTLRPCPPLEIEASRTWDRVSVTQESSPRNIVISRVNRFQRAGGNVIDVKLSLTDQQSQQVSRLIDGLKNQEQDSRFEWCWDEISKFDRRGEITDLRNRRSGRGNAASDTESASESDSDDDMKPEIVMIHLVAKRVPKGHVKALALYNSIMSSPPPPPPSPPGGPPFPRAGMPPPAPPPPPGMISWMSGKPPKKASDPRKSKGKKRGKKYISDSESETDISSDSESGSESDGSERQSKSAKTFRIKIKLNKGDDLVKALLDLWTPQSGAGESVAAGKGKEKEKERKSKH